LVNNRDRRIIPAVREIFIARARQAAIKEETNGP